MLTPVPPPLDFTCTTVALDVVASSSWRISVSTWLARGTTMTLADSPADHRAASSASKPTTWVLGREGSPHAITDPAMSAPTSNGLCLGQTRDTASRLPMTSTPTPPLAATDPTTSANRLSRVTRATAVSSGAALCAGRRAAASRPCPRIFIPSVVVGSSRIRHPISDLWKTANSPTKPCGQPWLQRVPLQSGPWQSPPHRVFPAAHSNG